MTGDPHVLAPDRAPTPFTAEEIRGRCATGKTIRVRVDVPGQPPAHRVTRYLDCDEAGATLERTPTSADGVPVGEAQRDRMTWLDLQSHASFPAAETTIGAERIETPMGALDCLRYTVVDDDGERTFWFARDLPGMPVRYVTRVGGEVVMTVTVEESSLPGERG